MRTYSSQDYPLQKKHHSREFLRTKAHLRPRTRGGSAVRGSLLLHVDQL